jgi:hypothetical protein
LQHGSSLLQQRKLSSDLPTKQISQLGIKVSSQTMALKHNYIEPDGAQGHHNDAQGVCGVQNNI